MRQNRIESKVTKPIPSSSLYILFLQLGIQWDALHLIYPSMVNLDLFHTIISPFIWPTLKIQINWLAGRNQKLPTTKKSKLKINGGFLIYVSPRYFI